jgi:hypothetical protein
LLGNRVKKSDEAIGRAERPALRLNMFFSKVFLMKTTYETGEAGGWFHRTGNFHLE